MAARTRTKVGKPRAGLGTPGGPQPNPFMYGREALAKYSRKTGGSAASDSSKTSAPATQAAAAAAAKLVPFLTPQDIMDKATTEGAITQQLGDLDRQLGDLKVNTGYGLQQNETNATKGKSAVNDDAAGRGIFSSSVRDAGIFDVEAQRAMQQKFLNDQLATAQIDYETKRAGLNRQLIEYQKGMAAKAAQNASELSAVQDVPDTGGVPAPPSVPAPGSSRPGLGGGMFQNALPRPGPAKGIKKPRSSMQLMGGWR